MGLQGPAGPTNAWVNQTTAGVLLDSTTLVTVASLDLPAGSYLLSAKSKLERNSGTITVTCSIRNGSTVLDEVSAYVSSTIRVNPAVLQSPVTLAAPTTITMRCNRSGSGSVDVSFTTLSAQAFTNLTVQ